MRGAHLWQFRLGVCFGIIPAYAGSTSRCAADGTLPRDHPRVCGEHDLFGKRQWRVKGSSPRMRGAPGKTIVMTAWLGIIPAYAGSTTFAALVRRGSRDHPRVCGEHVTANNILNASEGSSPRMRGAPPSPPSSAAGEGIIPAYAGSTTSIYHGKFQVRDHPRVCGEHSRKKHVCKIVRGSSPRMRGAPATRFSSAVMPGIIPAYAGSTKSGKEFGWIRRDHPRVCGEHVMENSRPRLS